MRACPQLNSFILLLCQSKNTYENVQKEATTMSQVQVTSIEEPKEAEPTAHIKSPVPLWRNRDYVLLWREQMISSVGTRVSMLAFPLLVLAINHSPAQAGLIRDMRT